MYYVLCIMYGEGTGFPPPRDPDATVGVNSDASMVGVK